MIQPASRPLMAHAVIGLSLVVGAHMILVDPAARQLAAARAQVAQRESDEARLRTIQAALPTIDAASQRASAEAEAIRSGSAPASDSGSLFADLAALAARHNVRVDQLDPFEPRAVSTAPAPAASADSAAVPPRDSRLGYTMTLAASYADLTAFLRSVQRELGFVRVVSVRITPGHEGDVVTARVQTVHHSFEVRAAGASAPTTPAQEGGPP